MYGRIVLGVCALVLVALGGWLYLSHRPSAPAAQAPELDASQVLGAFNPTYPNNPTAHAMTATLHTSMGDIVIEFSTSTAPNTVANFEKLASSGFYDGTKFHRVIKSFMIQGGDPLSKDGSQMSRWGTGGPGYTFPDELGPDNHNAAGTIAMANSGPDTNGSQFFINAVDNSYLDDKHTVFGKVVSGMDVVEAIDAVQTDSSDRPVTPVVIESVSLK